MAKGNDDKLKPSQIIPTHPNNTELLIMRWHKTTTNEANSLKLSAQILKSSLDDR